MRNDYLWMAISLIPNDLHRGIFFVGVAIREFGQRMFGVVDDGFSCRTVGGVNPTPINQSLMAFLIFDARARKLSLRSIIFDRLSNHFNRRYCFPVISMYPGMATDTCVVDSIFINLSGSPSLVVRYCLCFIFESPLYI